MSCKPCQLPTASRFSGMRLDSTSLGVSLIELLVSISIAGVIMLALNEMLGMGLRTVQAVRAKNDLTRQAQFAMNRMLQTIQSSSHLLLPLNDNPDTPRVESIRGDTNLDSGVVAVTLNQNRDLDADGIPDADNDGDGFFDEDLPADVNNDGRGGIADIDDDKNILKDSKYYSMKRNDDENSPSGFFFNDEDPVNGIDDDGDGMIDEDPSSDMNNDGCSGACDLDEDGDGSNNEDDPRDDDEDGRIDEDWFDSVVFYEKDGLLYQRTPVPWDENNDGKITGADYVESVIADNVSLFIVTRLTSSGAIPQIIELQLQLSSSQVESIFLKTKVRLRGF